jgi:hypothetical protein
MDQEKQVRARDVKTKLFHVFGSDDSINTCDCCGKTGLKATFAIEMIETGEILHYGSVCVTRNTGRKTGELNKMKDSHDMERREAARKEWRATPEYAAHEIKRKAALARGLIGMEFKAACMPERGAADTVSAQIAARHNIEK